VIFSNPLAFPHQNIHLFSHKERKTMEITLSEIEQKIYLIRGRRVMLDSDLAQLYSVATMRLNEAVKRNLKRFPSDFMYVLTSKEVSNLISQNAISSSQWGGRRKSIHVFTEQGVAMLSSVLNSDRAIEVNIAIMRVFVKIREMLYFNKELSHKLDQLEQKIEKHDEEIRTIFEAIRQLMMPPETPKRRIGFHAHHH
jgi:hypothetical protein